MNTYKDLYINLEPIKLKENPSFEFILSHFKENESISKEFIYEGTLITAKRKFTFIGGGGKMFQIKTNYLHIYFNNLHYREQKDNTFKQI